MLTDAIRTAWELGLVTVTVCGSLGLRIWSVPKRSVWSWFVSLSRPGAG